MSNSQADERTVKQSMRPNIRISHALNGRVKDYAAENDLDTSDAYQRVIEEGIEVLERDSPNEIGNEDARQESAAVDIRAAVEDADWDASNYARTESRVVALVSVLEHLREQQRAKTPELVAMLDEQLGDDGNNQRLLSDICKSLEIVESPPSGSNVYNWTGVTKP